MSGTVSFSEGLARIPPTPAIDAIVVLRANIIAGPPRADAGEDELIECTSPLGTPIRLDATASDDPDDDLVGFSWSIVSNDELVPVGAGSLVTAIQDLGTRDYVLVAADSVHNAGFDQKTVTVQDTTPPTISDFANNGPTCLWAPRHQYVVLRVGEELTAMVEDACDANPVLEIVSAVSDQPDNSRGDGDTTNDIVMFPDRVCLRSERDGEDRSGRLYSVSLLARDASGNVSDPTFNVRVSHDQRPGSDCPRLDNALFVADDDPLCAPAAAAPDAPDAEPADSADERSGSPSSTPIGGCSSSGGGSRAPIWFAVALVGLAVRTRRASRSVLASACVLVACSCTQPAANATALQACVVGVWMQPARLALPCPTTSCAECDEADCTNRSFQWFRADGVRVHGFFISSVTAATFSSAGPPLEGTWSVDGTELVTDGERDALSCSTDAMLWGNRNLERADGRDDDFAGAYERRDDDGSWRAQPYNPD